MERNNIAEKIKLLLKLSESPNEYEASLAASKAQELLAKYNMSMDDIELSEVKKDGAIITRTSYHGSYGVWSKILITIVARSCDCEPFMETSVKSACFIGLKHDALVAQYMYDYLFNTILRLSGKYIDDIRAKNNTLNIRNVRAVTQKTRSSYCMGIVSRLNERLEREKESVEEHSNSSALVVLRNSLIKEIADNLHLRNHSNRGESYYKNHYQNGYDDGSKISLNKPISGNENGTQKFIN